jgi:tripartite-type tricarboxylate transporter receptor subunit TctC
MGAARSTAAVATIAFLALGTGQVSTASAEDFFKGKQVNFVVGYSPGGGYDTYTRLLANVLGKHIPGNPDVIVTNMPGGGSLKAANYTYNVAPKDGTYLGVFSLPVAIEPLLGNKNAKFDAAKFGWLGNMYRDTHGCAVRNESSIKTLQDVIDAKEPVVFGASSASSYGNQHARVLQAMVGAKIKIVLGYRGIKGVGKALEQGEITAACAMAVSTLKSAFRPQKESGKFRMIVQFGKEKHPYMDNATMFYSMLKSDEEVKVADFFFSQSAIARPVAAPPGIPAENLATLRKAFAASLTDPALEARAKQIGIDVIPETPEAVQAALSAIYATPPATLARAKEIMGRK